MHAVWVRVGLRGLSMLPTERPGNSLGGSPGTWVVGVVREVGVGDGAGRVRHGALGMQGFRLWAYSPGKVCDFEDLHPGKEGRHGRSGESGEARLIGDAGEC